MSAPLRVLIVEDSDDDALLMLRMLERGGYEPAILRVDTPEAMSAALDGQNWDVILADYVLPRFSALAALALMRERGLDLPFIVISGKISADVAVEAMKSGAHDYLTKGNLARLVPAIEREMRHAKARHERKRAEKELRESEQKYHRVFSEARDGIALIDADTGFIVDCNPAFEEQTGKPLRELQKMKTWELGPPDKVDGARKRFLRILKTGPRGLSESEFRKPNGELVPVELAGKVVTIRDKRYLQTVSRDITERKRAEEALIEKDRAIRNAYVDVLNAVTGGRLIIMTKEEIEASLAKTCGPVYDIVNGEDLSLARSRLREALAQHFDGETAEDIVLAANEAMSNALKHAGSGHVRICSNGEISQIVITDSGPGIDFSILPKATLWSGFSTKLSLGMGFSIMLELCDRVKLATQPGYTCIALEASPQGKTEATFPAEPLM